MMMFTSAARTFGKQALAQPARAMSTAASRPMTRRSSSPLFVGLLGGIGAYYAYSSHALSSDSSKELAFSQDFKPFKLIDHSDYNSNTATFTFAIPEGQTGELPVCSALLVRVEKDGKPVVRPYTPVTPPGVEDRLDLLIKKYPEGNVSNFIHGLKVGDSIEIKGPNRKFPYQANQFKDVILLAGGTGITPNYQIIQDIQNNPNDKTRIHLIFANNDKEDILLKEKLDPLVKDGHKVSYVLTNPPKDWSGPTGYITPDLIKSTGLTPKDNVHVFVCGPPPFMKALSGPKTSKGEQGEIDGALKELGYSIDQVYKF